MENNGYRRMLAFGVILMLLGGLFLLSRVAPDRKKPGLNPADTGPFEGRAGAQPESFRWEIESARGYAPR